MAVTTTEGHDNRAKTVVKSRAKEAKQRAMMVLNEAEILLEDVDASTSEISVNVNQATITVAMENQRMVKMDPMVMPIVVPESHASAHAIDQIKIAVAIRYTTISNTQQLHSNF